MRALPHAIQRREADAQSNAPSVAPARNLSARIGIAPARLPRLPWPARQLQLPARTSRGIKPPAGDQAAVADGRGPDRARNVPRARDGRVARRSSRKAVAGRIENTGRSPRLGETAV